MRKIFLFWGAVLLILILGAAAIIYGKMLLRKEQEKTDEIVKKMVFPARDVDIPKLPVEPVIPPEVDIEEAPVEVEMLEPVAPPETEVTEDLEDTELHIASEDESFPLIPPKQPEVRALTKPLTPPDVNVPKEPEMPPVEVPVGQ